jgi:hypothetical protein
MVLRPFDVNTDRLEWLNECVGNSQTVGTLVRLSTIDTNRSAIQIGRDERPQNRFQGRALFAGVRLARFKVDPTFVEAIDHPNPRYWVLHALRAKHCLPLIMWDCFHLHRALQYGAKSRGNIVRGVAPRTFEFNNADSRHVSFKSSAAVRAMSLAATIGMR